MKVFELGDKCAVSLVDGVVCFPKRLANELQEVIDAAREQGAREAKAAIRAALGVDAAIEEESAAIYYNIGPQ